MRYKIFWLLAFFFLPLGSLFSSIAFSASLPPGDHSLALKHGGRDRTYIVHMPPSTPQTKQLPVVLNLHGGGGRVQSQKSYSRMDALADQEGFIVVYPNGTGRMADRLLTWNAGTCCAYSVLNRVDDVGFVLALLKQLEGQAPIDRGRIYATGLSNGAMMAYRLAAEAGDQIAAIAPVAGGMVVPAIKTSRAVPVMHFHSVDDPRALYHGGLGLPFPFTHHQEMHPDIESMIAHWAEHDGCPKTPQVTTELRGKQGPREADQTALEYVYSPCREKTEVILWKLSGAGHVWPGGQPNYFPHLLGPSTGIIDANREMWGFFLRFSMNH